ncbi:MAG: hypothetical protein EAZ90_05630 [Oscillatoriales cyanobacterium]|nr:MAG: hypothetical protein EAZ94_01780 [Oscillatoriales cyanobacterium]TAE28035.1 MAG: hypothetical protein EAZ93_04615 [Oscillatoriales cyanobacterium]TAE44659.1 MAG: hypothetical protein EAZ90_05630 [Oscillatoriales cyanobacterium]TAE57843.1 MAG: hypothetical protein EAZ88_00525 [Oscillatoriales cyanobacterium]TAE71294.1 MAG: hypothetical protein EAZ86_04780 [Oscillatoriales cyanobacterium]
MYANNSRNFALSALKTRIRNLKKTLKKGGWNLENFSFFPLPSSLLLANIQGLKPPLQEAELF